jgi:hypothetical protein
VNKNAWMIIGSIRVRKLSVNDDTTVDKELLSAGVMAKT